MEIKGDIWKLNPKIDGLVCCKAAVVSLPLKINQTLFWDLSKLNLFYITLEVKNIRNAILNHLIATELKMLFFIKIL